LNIIVISEELLKSLESLTVSPDTPEAEKSLSMLLKALEDNGNLVFALNIIIVIKHLYSTSGIGRNLF